MVTPRAPHLPPAAMAIFEAVSDLPIVSPHGHCDPAWWAEDAHFPNPAELLIQPDHYVFRMLYSQGVRLEDLGLGDTPRDPREVFARFARHWHLFLGTPSRIWLEHTLYQVLKVATDLTPDSADEVYDQIQGRLSEANFRPRALFDRFKLELLATTDRATDTLSAHKAIAESDWSGRVIPTFRPDDILNPNRTGHRLAMQELAEITNLDISDYATFLDAIRQRRASFRALGARATDHDVPLLHTTWLARSEIEDLHFKAMIEDLTPDQAQLYYGHMLVEMAQLAAEDGMVMQIHAGSNRNTNQALFDRFGPDKGADIPVAMDWVNGLTPLLTRVGNNPNLRIILFTLDEGGYARELAPMAGHWPSLRIGPPWWFHDSLNGMRRYFDQVVETAGYFNLSGFNDDTRAFLSIPARHDLWRRAVALHLADQVDRGLLKQADALRLAPYLCRDQAIEAYRLPLKWTF